VSRPLVVGTMAGTAVGRRLLDKRGMRTGDRILLTKGLAVEGTGLIAREFGDRLKAAGMSAGEVDACAALLERMSILDEARIALSFEGVTALHDVTEGGLAMAVTELGAAGGRRLRVDMDGILVYPETRHLCALLGLDPLGLIGSGSLLITCAEDQAGALATAIAAEGIEATVIGKVLEEGRGIEAWQGGERRDWPRFPRDEVSRLTD
jgi:hydrogenase expression/formation protein HypE